MMDEPLFMVVRSDTNGVCYLVAENLSAVGADDRIQSLVKGHTKPHKMDYWKIPYTLATRADVIREHGINV